MSSRSRPAGLPSGPGPRSRSVARTRDVERDRYDDDSDAGRPASRSSTRQVRSQKSMTSLNQSRSDPRPPPPMPSSRSRRNPDSYDSRPDSRSGTNRSSDSTTSSGSSFLDRMKASAGYASSRTSLEDDEASTRSARSTTRTKPQRRDSSPPPGMLLPGMFRVTLMSDPSETESDTPGDGHSLWGKVASAAGLTVNAKANTPAGQESRLTRAMKAYHVEKARDPSDLPAWLFDEKERRRAVPEPSRSRRRDDDDDDYKRVEKPRAEAPQSRGLRDIYEAAASSQSAPSIRSTRAPRSHADDIPPQPSKATDRLRALRDAKRTVVAPHDEREEPRREERAPEAGRRRVGLPSGPVSRRGQ
ncbi:hypothetical protein B0H15DRAFT_945517 [Mycena belliarum]|uniref:Uncharacterized protein n=1 Tax=Mycena belliarum TaxID=1033014 RepID=A0AAD6XRE8_9AGAR|nr:hypothetical protein B0H15DRAFT_945517 [Mycena belliae]